MVDAPDVREVGHSGNRLQEPEARERLVEEVVERNAEDEIRGLDDPRRPAMADTVSARQASLLPESCVRRQASLRT